MLLQPFSIIIRLFQPSSFNTASGRHCCNTSKRNSLESVVSKVSIPQAISTVASSPLFSLPFGQGLEMCGPHRRFAPLLPRTLRRIPQAVGTVATCYLGSVGMKFYSFNTASGKHCCNINCYGSVKVKVSFQYRKR